MAKAQTELDEADFAELIVEPRKKRWIWLVYALLFAAAIPWYWPEGYRGPLVLGLPQWVAVTLGCVFLLALWTAWVIFNYWETDDGQR